MKIELLQFAPGVWLVRTESISEATGRPCITFKGRTDDAGADAIFNEYSPVKSIDVPAAAYEVDQLVVLTCDGEFQMPSKEPIEAGGTPDVDLSNQTPAKPTPSVLDKKLSPRDGAWGDIT